MAAQHAMNVLATKIRLALSLTASFPGELRISPIKDFLQAAHDALELTTIAHQFRLSACRLLFSHMSILIVVMTEPLFASCAFPHVEAVPFE